MPRAEPSAWLGGSRRARTLAWLAVVLGLLAPRPAGADGDELGRLGDEIARLGAALDGLVRDGLSPDVIKGMRSFKQRMTDAEVLFLLADYPRAALVLFDLAEDARYAEEPLYGRAVYYLAESYYQMGNDGLAQQAFERCLARNDEFSRDAMQRLVQIADRNRHWEGIDERLAALEQQAALLPELAYLLAKSYVRRGRPKDALALVARVPTWHRLSAKARYVGAVATLELGEADAAAAEFAAITELSNDKLEDLSQVIDMAAINRGRLLLQAGDLAQSAQAYRKVGRHSPFFTEALYELSWVHVRAAALAAGPGARRREYKSALAALEVLLVSEIEATLGPEARLMLGNVLLKLGRYDEATGVFAEVTSRYTPVRDALAKLAVEARDPAAFYDELVRRRREGEGLLPAPAAAWAVGAERLSQTSDLLEQLDTSGRWLDESRAVAGKLMAALEAEDRARFFPALREPQLRRVEVSATLNDLMERLLTYERQALWGILGGPLQKKLLAVLEERARLEPQYRALPQKRQDYEARVQEVGERLAFVQRQAYQLRYPLETMRRELDAMVQWLVQSPGTLSRQEAASFRQRIAQQRREVESLTALQRELEEQVSREKALISVTHAAQSQEELLRARYVATLERERELLAAAARVAPPKLHGAMATVERHRLTLAGYYTALQGFSERLDGVAAATATDARAQVLAQVGLLEAHQAELAGLWGGAKSLAGEAAAEELAALRDRFRDVVLRADVGLVDVAWQMKEDETQEISRRVSAQKREVGELDAEFRDVLRE